MSFKTNLQTKIRIDRLTEQVLDSLGTPESGRKIDKPAMRTLLETAGYQGRTEREMELYARAFSDAREKILVLDNELKIYDTTLADVLLRKNPYIREMVSIRNIKKILNDRDIVVSRGPDTVRAVRHQCLEDLDLSYTAADIESIYQDGVAAIDNENPRQLMEVLDLFAELLQLSPPPKTARVSDLKVLGPLHQPETDQAAYGPIILYVRSNRQLKQFEQTLSRPAMQKAETFKDLAYGEQEPDRQDHAVLDDLQNRVPVPDGAAVPVD